MKVNDLLQKTVGENVALRTQAVNRLLRLGFTVETDVTAGNKSAIEGILNKVANTNPAESGLRTASILNATGPTVSAGADARCPVCKSMMVEGMLHTNLKTAYCPKCRVAAKPNPET